MIAQQHQVYNSTIKLPTHFNVKPWSKWFSNKTKHLLKSLRRFWIFWLIIQEMLAVFLLSGLGRSVLIYSKVAIWYVARWNEAWHKGERVLQGDPLKPFMFIHPYSPNLTLAPYRLGLAFFQLSFFLTNFDRQGLIWSFISGCWLCEIEEMGNWNIREDTVNRTYISVSISQLIYSAVTDLLLIKVEVGWI